MYLYIQSYLVNSKLSGLEVLFQIMGSLSYREVNMQYITSKIYYYQSFFLLIKHVLVRKRNVYLGVWVIEISMFHIN